MAVVSRFVNTASSGGDGTTNGTSGADAAYASLSSWEANQTGGASDDYIVDCSGTAADTTNVTLNFATTPLSITIRGNRSDAAGFYDGDALISTSHYRLTSSTNINLAVQEPDVTIDGIQFEITTATAFRSVIQPEAARLTVRNCRARNSNAATAFIGNNSSARTYTGTYLFENNLMVGFSVAGIDITPNAGNSPTVNIYNNTIYRGSAGDAIKLTGASGGSAVANIKNNIVANTDATPFNIDAAWTVNYDTNGTDNGSVGTTNEVDLTPGAGDLDDVFTARGTGQSADFTLIAGSPAIDAGISSGMPTTDIRDLPRTGSFDLGAFEVQAGGTQTITVSLDAAIRRQQALSSVLDAAIRRPVTATSNIDAAIRLTRTAAVSVDGAIRSTQSVLTTIDAALQTARTATATLDTAVRTNVTAATVIDAFIQAGFQALTTIDAAIRLTRTAGTTLDAGIQTGRTAQALIDAVIRATQTAAMTMDSAIRIAAASGSTIDAAIRIARTAQATIDAAIARGFAVTAILDAAIRSTVTATAILDAVIEDPLSVPPVGRTQIVAGRGSNVVGARDGFTVH